MLTKTYILNFRSGRTSRGAQVFERFGCAVDSERKFKAKNRIRTVISQILLSSFLNLFKLVYEPFEQSIIYPILNFCKFDSFLAGLDKNRVYGACCSAKGPTNKFKRVGTYCSNIYCGLRAGWHWQEIGKIGGRIVTYGSYMLGISHQAQCYITYYIHFFKFF